MESAALAPTHIRAIDSAMHPGRVSLSVADLRGATRFYERVLGLTLRSADEHQALLGPQEGDPLIQLTAGALQGARRSRTTGLYHMALLYPSRTALGAALLRLATTGYAIQGASDHGVSEAIYLADSEGNGLELYADRPRAVWPRMNGTLAMVADPLDLDQLLHGALTAGQDGSQTVSALRMGHIHLHVARLEPAIAFYREGLGLKLVQRYGDQAAFLAAGEYHHHIGINTWAGLGAAPPHPDSPGLRTFDLVLPSDGSLQSTIDHLRAYGAPLQAHEASYETQDPSANRLVLRSARPQPT